MGPAEVQVLIQGMFDYKADLAMFKNHLRDFLVQTKQFKSMTTAQCSRRSRRRGRRQSARASMPSPE